MSGDVQVLLTRDAVLRRRRMPSPTPAGTAATSCCRRRHDARRSSVMCPYHAWTYDLDGSLQRRARLPRRPATSRPQEHGLVALPVRGVARAGCSSTRPATGGAVRRARRRRSTRLVAPYAPETPGARRPAHLRGRGQLEGHRGELPRVLPLPADPPGAVPGLARPTSGDNYDLPGSWVGGTMDLRDARRHDVARRAQSTVDRSRRRRADVRCAYVGPVPEPAGLRLTPTT